MKKLRRLFALAVLAALCCALLTGCHGSRERSSFTVPDALDESRSFELTFWAKNDTNKTQTAVYEKAKNDFEALYPNVRVNIRLYTDYGRIYNDVITNISTNTTPNICITYPDHIATYLTGDEVVVPLDELMSDSRWGLGGSELRFDGPSRDEIVPYYLSEGVLGSHQYALPYMRSTEACYVNKTMVEALGYELPETLTWDFVWEVSEAAVKKDADGSYLINGQKTMIPFIYKSTDNMMIQMLRQRGAGYADANGNISIFNDVTRELLLDIAGHTKSGAFSTFKISSYPANFLNAGQCIFAIDSTAGATWIGTHAPLLDISPDKLVEFETEVMTIPQFDPDDPKMISQGPSVCVFNKEDPQEVMYSWLFAQFLLTNDVQLGYCRTEGYIPVTYKALESEEYQDYLSRCGEDYGEHYDVKIKASQLLFDNLANTFVTPVFNGSASLRDASGQMIESVVKSTRRGETVDDAYLDKLFDDVTALYHLDDASRMASSGPADLGPLPGTAVALLSALGAAWVLIGASVLVGGLRKKSNK